MLSHLCFGIVLAAVGAVNAQDSSSPSQSRSGAGSSSSSRNSSSTISIPSVSPIGSTITNPSVALPSASYSIPTAQMSAPTQLTSSATGNNTSSLSSTSNPLQLVGATRTMSNGTATTTMTSATPTNTQPCNGYPEFCNRKYSNITEVAAHNAAFRKPNNAFSNQNVAIVGQLNDGIRMIQGEVHFANGTLYNCHSDCDFLNTGPYEDTLTTVRKWLDAHPYDVVTLLIVNSNFANVTEYQSAFQNSGMIDYLYLPPRNPMRLNDWPTLQEMIFSNKRAVAFMDYGANADLVPYILDEFGSMWETPFSPTDTSFPCTQQRPDGLNQASARNDYMYMANHNLNVAIALGGSQVLIPNFSDLATVNANSSDEVSLSSMADRCTEEWDRPPNFLLVDFYDISNPNPGAVFEVAAAMNNVTYDGSCCGENTRLLSAASTVAAGDWTTLLTVLLISLGAIAHLW